MRNDPFPDDERSASEVVGVALLVGIVILGVTVVLLIGTPQLDRAQETIEVGQAEQALTQFASETFRVAIGGTTAQRVDLGLRANEGTLDVEESAGHITVDYYDPFDPDNGTEVMNTTLGAVVYETGDTSVAYQGGGVWRSDGGGSVMVSPPEISHDGKTLTMPVVTTARGGSVYSDVQVIRVASTERFPNATRDANLTNRIDDGVVQITIQSRYYRAWGQYFEDETAAAVAYVPSEETVVIVFLGSQFNLGEQAGIIATSGPGELRVEGSGSYIDSYNSTEGPYSETEDQNGSVLSAGNIDMFGGSQIRGNAESNKEILLDGGSEITGDACADDGVTMDGTSNVGGSTNCSATVPILPPLDEYVENRASDIERNNDNNATTHIENERLDFEGQNEIELPPGSYYLEKIEMENNRTLVLNASQGDIIIAVEDYVVLDEGHIEITGNNTDGTVRMLVASEESSGRTVQGTGGEPADHFYVNGQSKVSVRNDSSPRFQVLAPQRFTGAIRASGSDEARVTGIILAPTTTPRTSQFIVRDAELFGAVVTGNLTTENNAEVHFDHAVIGEDVPFGEGSLLDFLYVSENEVRVESS